MVRGKPYFAWIMAVTVVLLGGIAVAQQAADAKPSREDGWRRTANGWEQWPHATPVFAHRAALVTPQRVQSLPFPGSAHPAAWAGLQLSLSLLALAAFSSKDA